MHALIIEDDPDVAWSIANLLRDEGFASFEFAASEEAAVLAAQRHCPDLITADVQLVSGNGISAVRRICAERPVPVIYVTGSPEALSAVPAAVVVLKPFTDDQVRGAIAAARADPPSKGSPGGADPW